MMQKNENTKKLSGFLCPQVVKMVVLVMLVFVICWLPLQVISLYSMFAIDTPQGREPVRQHSGKNAGHNADSMPQDRTQVRQNSTGKSTSETIPPLTERWLGIRYTTVR